MERKVKSGENEVTRAQMLAPNMAFIAIYDTNDRKSKTDEPWENRALCRQVGNADAFFPEKGGSVKDAKAICGQCEVRGQCLEEAIGRKEKFGVWGGLTERERRKHQAERENGATAA
ncbi:MAG: whiB2 [Candidatus Saccharibacteria bacterium]|nr:whiB2 [Candidatus Saccharibacteria bacterium]